MRARSYRWHRGEQGSRRCHLYHRSASLLVSPSAGAAGNHTMNQALGVYSLAAIFAANSPAAFSISPGVPINAGKSFTRR